MLCDFMANFLWIFSVAPWTRGLTFGCLNSYLSCLKKGTHYCLGLVKLSFGWIIGQTIFFILCRVMQISHVTFFEEFDLNN